MKWTLLFVLLLGSFLSGLYLGSSKKGDVVYIQDTTPPAHTIIKTIDPLDNQDLLKRAQAPIEIVRVWNNPVLTIEASDGYKSVRVVDRINLVTSRHIVFAGYGVDKHLSSLYTLGYMYRISGSFSVGSYGSFASSYFTSVSVLVGYSF